MPRKRRKKSSEEQLFDNSLLLMSDEIAEKADMAQFGVAEGQQSSTDFFICALEQVGAPQNFVGTLLTYDVEEGLFEIVLDSKSINNLIRLSPKDWFLTVGTVKEEIKKVKASIKKYNLSDQAGIVTVREHI